MSTAETAKEHAIRLRRKGKTYSEILKIVPIVKSTLSLWLRDVGLSKKQTQRITKKRIEAQHRGAVARRDQRIESTRRVVNFAETEIPEFSREMLLVAGAILYWAEGGKQKHNNVSQQMVFSNSDPLMIRLFVKWVEQILNCPKPKLVFEIYIHNCYNVPSRLESVRCYWAHELGVSADRLNRIYFKKIQSKKTNRKNVGEGYNGLIRVRVPKSSMAVRRVVGWVRGICKNCGIV